MSSRFEFHMPTRDMMDAKLAYLLSNVRPELAASRFAPFIDAVAGKITMRPFTSYILRYLFDDDPLSSMMANVRELADARELADTVGPPGEPPHAGDSSSDEEL